LQVLRPALAQSPGDAAQLPSPQQKGVLPGQQPSSTVGQHWSEARQQPPLSQAA
jgi:hypothetical protein